MSNNRPSHRISFARIVSTDGMGNDKLGSAREIGTIWPRENGKGAILRFDHIPVEMSRHEGVIFVNEVGSAYEHSSPKVGLPESGSPTFML